MADAEPHPGADAQNPLPWLRNAHIVNLGSKYAFPPFLDDPEGSLRDHLNDVGPFDKEIYVLDLLQRTRATGLNASALQILLNALVDALPKAIQDKVGLHMSALPTDGDTGAVIGQPNWFSQRDDDFEKTVQGFEDNDIPPLSSGNKEFILWVVNGGTPEIPYYITIVLRYGPLDRITHWGIIDALNIDSPSHTTKSAKARITRLLSGHGIADAAEHQIWVPPYQEDGEFASGLVAYSAVTQLLDRIGIMHCAGGNFDANAFFAHTRPWFNADALRAESLGRAAMKAMEKLDWKARLALFPIRPFADGERERVQPFELAPKWTPPVAHTIPAPGVSADGDSLFEEPQVQDAASQTVEAPGHEPAATTTQAAGTQTDQGHQLNVLPSPSHSPSPSSSSSSSSGSTPNSPGEAFDPAFQNYVTLKTEGRDRVLEEVVAAEEACNEAAAFSDRLVYEVLEAPNNNIPSAYAVERLFWLVRRAIERTRSADQQNALLRRCYTTATTHTSVMTQLELEQTIARLQEQIDHLRQRYTVIDQQLNTAYAARRGRAVGQLADVDDVAGGADGGGGGSGGSGGGGGGGGGGGLFHIPGDSDDDDDAAEPGPSNQQKPEKNPKKRKYTFDNLTSTLDSDGQHVFTMNVHRKPRKAVKKSKKH
ncbi:hypothetical protein F5B21DRAFT_114774 [Xylaria acuta]|nr:hypothetical protein F5B21DRAFT_114774 [Xylaria acuta]